jgi:hypothetical protein
MLTYTLTTDGVLLQRHPDYFPWVTRFHPAEWVVVFPRPEFRGTAHYQLEIAEQDGPTSMSPMSLAAHLHARANNPERPLEEFRTYPCELTEFAALLCQLIEAAPANWQESIEAAALFCDLPTEAVADDA